jgi:hypothetical protein
MLNSIDGETDAGFHIHNFSTAWTALSVLEQTQLIEEFRRRITQASSADSGIVRSPAACLMHFQTSLRVLGYVTDEFAQFFGACWLSPVRSKVENQVSRFFDGILEVNHSPSVLELVPMITARATQALQK